MKFANFILQKIAETPVFNDFHVKSSSPHSLVHLLPTSSSKSAPGIRVFYDFYVKSSSLPTSSSKRCPNASVFYNCYLKSSSRLSLVHFLSTTFADRGPHKQKQRPYFGDHGSHFTRKKHRLSFPRVFSTLNSCVPDLLHFPTTWWRWRWRLRWRWRWWWWWW